MAEVAKGFMVLMVFIDHVRRQVEAREVLRDKAGGYPLDRAIMSADVALVPVGEHAMAIPRAS